VPSLNRDDIAGYGRATIARIRKPVMEKMVQTAKHTVITAALMLKV
jgi:hypothetical protein